MTKRLVEGDVVPIPCRHCHRPIRFTVAPGSRRLACAACAQQTEVLVESRGGSLLVFTSRVSAVRSSAATDGP